MTPSFDPFMPNPNPSGPDELRKWLASEPLRGNLTVGEYDYGIAFADAWQLLIDAVNENSGTCSAECNSFGHAEDCKYVDMAASLSIQQDKIVDLRTRLEAAREGWDLCLAELKRRDKRLEEAEKAMLDAVRGLRNYETSDDELDEIANRLAALAWEE